MHQLFDSQHLKKIEADFDHAYIISDCLVGKSEFYSNDSIVVLNQLSGKIRLVSERSSILIGGNISGACSLTAYKDIIIKGTISGKVEAIAQTGNIYLIKPIRYPGQFSAPNGQIF